MNIDTPSYLWCGIRHLTVIVMFPESTKMNQLQICFTCVIYNDHALHNELFELLKQEMEINRFLYYSLYHR